MITSDLFKVTSRKKNLMSKISVKVNGEKRRPTI